SHGQPPRGGCGGVKRALVGSPLSESTCAGAECLIVSSEPALLRLRRLVYFKTHPTQLLIRKLAHRRLPNRATRLLEHLHKHGHPERKTFARADPAHQAQVLAFGFASLGPLD